MHNLCLPSATVLRATTSGIIMGRAGHTSVLLNQSDTIYDCSHCSPSVAVNTQRLVLDPVFESSMALKPQAVCMR